MKPNSSLRIFAGHYQFFVYDADANPFDPLPDYSEEAVERGWTRTERSIAFLTRAHLNDYRLDLYLGRPPALKGCDRATIHVLRLTSGRLAIHSTEGHLLAKLEPGYYTLVMAAYNLGAEQSFEEAVLPDDVFLARTEWERYELYVYESEGKVIEGPYGP
jgi:hypothetical protein